MVEFYLDGQLITSPFGWSGAMVNSIFMERSQPDITVEEFTFEKDADAIIEKWLTDNGHYRGCPFVIKRNTIEVFNGYLDFKTKNIKVHDGKRIVAIKKAKGLNQLADKIEGYTMGLLAKRAEDRGQPLQTVDIPYVVVKKYTVLEFAMLSVTIYMLIKELNETIKTLQSDVNKLTEATAGIPYSYGQFIGAVLQSLVNLAYAISMVLALKDLLLELINSLYSLVKTHKGFLIKSHLQEFVEQIDFNGIEFGFSEFENLYYFPSKEEDVKSTGIPNANDYGYLISEQVEFIRSAFASEFAVDDKAVVQVRSENDPYFIRNSKFVLPDILQESIEYNTTDLKGTKLMSFKTDVTDEWTLDNYTGTSYEVHTRSKTTNGESLIDGYEEIRLNVALANRKDSFTTLEKRIKEVAQLGDEVINTLGGDSNMSGKIKKRLGYIKVGAETWSEPKIMRLNSNLQLDANHRENWSAKYLIQTHHANKSFVLNDYAMQREIKKGVVIPMCDEDYQNLQNNSYFTTNDGSYGKFTKLDFSLQGGSGIGDCWIKKVYDRNLEEEYIEP